MAHRVQVLEIGSRERAQLEEWAESDMSPRRLAFRAKICLLAAEGMTNSRVAQCLDTSRATVRLWKERFLQGGPEALVHDAPRGPSPRRIDGRLRAKILNAVEPSQEKAGFRWTTRSLAKALGVSNATISRVWRSHGVEPSKQGFRRNSEAKEGVSTGSEVVGIYAEPSVLLLVIRIGCDCLDDASQTNDCRGLGQEHPRTRIDSDEYADNGCSLLGSIDSLEKIHFNILEEENAHRHLREFLEKFVQDSSGDCQYRILIFEPVSDVQSLVETVAKSSPWVNTSVLPNIPDGKPGTGTSLYSWLQGLRLSIRPTNLVRFLKAIDVLVKQGNIDKSPLVWSSLFTTSKANGMGEMAGRTIKAVVHFIHGLKRSKVKKPKFVFWIGGHPVNWKQKFESLFAAASFAEAGEHETALYLSQRPVPDLRESLGLVSSLFTTFAAAAFAEENCHEMAADLLPSSAPQSSFLEDVGLVGLRVHYGLVSVESSFTDIIGLSGVRYRMLTLRL